ncbi:MAG: hypothetical protein STHCBS139747_003795 [Sporothrix thermara]
MSSLSIFAGPMTLLSAATSATSEVMAVEASELTPTRLTAAAATPAEAAAVAATNLSLRSPSASLVYRCHSSAAQAWALAATAAQPLTRTLRLLLRFLLLASAAVAGVAQVALQHSWQALRGACWWHFWACPRATRVRKRLCFELALVVMGPSGNGLLLVLLWPGWLVLAAGIWGLSALVAGV